MLVLPAPPPATFCLRGPIAGRIACERQQTYPGSTQAGVDSRVTTVTHATLPEFVAQTDSYFLDFFAPWCPPCKRMLPIFREVSVNHPEIKFGTVDCTRETLLCNNYAIQSYPSPVFFHAGEEHHFDGDTTDPGAFAEFIEDVYNPPVVSITPLMFETDIIHAPSELWMVDFYAPWCGHCQQLEPEYRYAAKRLAGVAKLGKVGWLPRVPSRCALHDGPPLAAAGWTVTSPLADRGRRPAARIAGELRRPQGLLPAAERPRVPHGANVSAGGTWASKVSRGLSQLPDLGQHIPKRPEQAPFKGAASVPTALSVGRQQPELYAQDAACAR